MMAGAFAGDRANCPQACRPIRLHGSGIARRAASAYPASQSEGLLNAPLVSAEMGGDVLDLAALVAKKSRGGRFILVQLARASDAKTIENHPGLGVLESGHGCSSIVAAVVSSDVRVRRLHSEGRFLEPNRPSHTNSRSIGGLSQRDSESHLFPLPPLFVLGGVA